VARMLVRVLRYRPAQKIRADGFIIVTAFIPIPMEPSTSVNGRKANVGKAPDTTKTVMLLIPFSEGVQKPVN